jgi:hypothetical protein
MDKKQKNRSIPMNFRKSVLVRTIVLGIILLVTGPYVYGQILVSGTVKESESGTKLIGVTVIEKGTLNGTITDAEGNYRITVKDSTFDIKFFFCWF